MGGKDNRKIMKIFSLLLREKIILPAVMFMVSLWNLE